MGGSTQQIAPMAGGKGAISSAISNQPKYGDPQTGGPQMQPAVMPQLNDAQNSPMQDTIMGGSASDGYGQRKGMAYPNTINQWDNPQQSIQKQMPSYGKGSSTASSRLPSPLTNNYSMGGKGKGA
jgi:hypothetical protein